MVTELFQIYGAKTTGKCICELKNIIYLFLLMSPKQNSSTGSHHHPFPPRSVFWISISILKGGGDYERAEKKT